VSARAFLVGAILSACSVQPLAAHAQGFTSLHPEEAYPDPTGPVSADEYTDFIRAVQERLRSLGFDAGPANGDFGAKTQTALAQFQLSRTLPASGSLDDETLAELGVRREPAEASAGGTQPSGEAPPPQLPQEPSGT
jgi:peptidoglycan hydrolase-like protein with peptidoglycan-binding domain